MRRIFSICFALFVATSIYAQFNVNHFVYGSVDHDHYVYNSANYTTNDSIFYAQNSIMEGVSAVSSSNGGVALTIIGVGGLIGGCVNYTHGNYEASAALFGLGGLCFSIGIPLTCVGSSKYRRAKTLYMYTTKRYDFDERVRFVRTYK